MESKNLNLLQPESDGNYGDREIELANNRLSHDVHVCQAQVFFNGLEEKLIEKINQYPVVVGCVAWLTNENILEALADKDKVSIIIQKEDFLRPDSGSWSGEKLRRLYQALPNGVEVGDIPDVNVACGWQTAPIRWAGVTTESRLKAQPRMHHKFLVFCEQEKPNNGCFGRLIPKAVWTGSFNLTHNATNSIENALFLTGFDVVNRYFLEWQHVFLISEDIPFYAWYDKFCDYLRIGT